MIPEEFGDFLKKLVSIEGKSKQKDYAMAFFDEMVTKYGNQFQPNSFLDQLIEILNELLRGGNNEEM